MVVMALVTTFMTTPVVVYLYPEWYQKETHASADEIPNSSDNRVNTFNEVDEKGSIKLSTVAAIGSERYSIVTMMNRIESVPSMMAIIQLLKRDRIATSIEIHALRLLELTERASVVMKYKDLKETEKQDPVLNVLRTFANLIGIKSLQTHLDYCPSTDYIKTVSHYGSEVEADLILLPWINRYLINNENYASALDNASSSDLEFVNQAFSVIQHCTIGLFVDRGFGQIQDGDSDLVPQIIVAYRENCQDDQAALLFALRLQAYRKIDLTVIRKSFTNAELLYATNETIQQYTHDHDINKLFISNDSSREIKLNVVCQSVEELNGPTIIRSLARPLDKHDLIILGRRGNGESTEKDGADYENALGKLGFSILKNSSKNTSVLIIQSASL
jgi:hypothetical protein